MTQLPGQAQVSEARLGFDTFTCVPHAVAALFRGSGCHFCIRYVSRTKRVPETMQRSGSISHVEAVGILEAGLALMLVQTAKRELMPTSSLGATVGEAAAYNAATIGYHQGCSLWCDVEAIDARAQPSDVLAYCNAWYDAVKSAGFKPGIYVGPNSNLTTADLHRKLKFASYWKSASKVHNVDTRGYHMIQSRSDNIHGIAVDFNISAVDSRGGRPVWLAPPPPTVFVPQ